MIDEAGARCTGCKACGDICPQDAIRFNENSEGFWYPSVDQLKCVRCGKCREVCGVIHEFQKNEDYTLLAYAAWNRDSAVRRESTSGGIYHCFAKYVLEQGGYIVGSAYTEDFCGAYHTCTNSINELPKIMGSKYFQSDTEGIYKTTKKLLSENRLVLFTGTPCQVAALKKFLNKDYDHLITVDFICRGVPSPKIQKTKLKEFEKDARSKIVEFKDKCDRYSWADFGEFIRFENGKEKFISRWDDDTFDCFIRRDLNIRESCYECNLKEGNNASEITIGDFWGVKRVTENDIRNGVSALIINNQRGHDFVQKLDETLYKEQRTIDEIKAGNPAYIQCPTKPRTRNEFFNAVNAKGLKAAVAVYSKKTNREKINSYKKILMMKLRKWRPLWKVKKDICWGKFIKYNYFSSIIERDPDAFIIPLKGTVLQFGKRARIILHGNLLLNYHPSYRRGKQTTLLNIADHGRFIVNNRVEISYNNTIVVNGNAELTMGFLFSNIGTNIISNCSITFGNHILIGRDVCVFDSDYHRIYNQNGDIINSNKAVVIGDNVWIGTRAMVMKGSHIEAGAVIGANSMVTGNVEGNRIYINVRNSKSADNIVFWER